VRNLIKKIIPANLKQDIKDELGVPSLSSLLKQLKGIGYHPKVAYDIGAYEGYWALDFQKVFPAATIYMFEAQFSKEDHLKKLCHTHPNFHYSMSLLGSQEGAPVHFEENETASQVTFAKSGRESQNRITETVNGLIKRKQYELPDFLKLDVQGYEIEILKGADLALSHAVFCLLEVSLIDLGEGSPLLIDVINFMDSKGFCSYDISQFIRRPYDQALWQIDLLFIKKDSKFIAIKRWA
jgi:FkbM family methyltransferase